MAGFARKYWWVFGGGLLLWLGAFYGVYQGNKAAYEGVHRAAIAGKIQAIQRQNHGFSIALELDNQQHYRFFPAEQQGGASGFMAAAAVGDSIRKKALTDTLLLFKNGKAVRYSFNRVLY